MHDMFEQPMVNQFPMAFAIDYPNSGAKAIWVYLFSAVLVAGFA
jgi:hypothetical protein